MSSIHFISGLPRSGSTLLAALLRQNPRFEAGMSGPLAGLFGALLGEMSARNEFSVFIDDVKRQRILRGLFDDFYADSKAEVIFDTNRAWCAWMPAIAQLFADAQDHCLRTRIAMGHRQYRADRPAQRLQPVIDLQLQTRRHGVHPRQRGGRAKMAWSAAPYDAHKQACFGAQRENLLLVQYETLTTDPAKTMHAIYSIYR